MVAILEGLRTWMEVPMSMEHAIVPAIADSETKPELKQLPVRSTTGRPASQGDMDVGHSHAFASRESTLLNFDEQRQALGGDPRYVAVTISHC
jgi:hypothetical protein